MTDPFTTSTSAMPHPMLELLESYDDKGKRFQRGDIVNGHIALIRDSEVLIDIGGKREGILSSREMSAMTKDDLAAMQVGDEVECLIINPEDRQGNLVLSLSQARIGQDWDQAEELHTNDQTFEATVSGHNKGGLIVYVGQVRGFVPASQIDRRHGFSREQIDGSGESPLASLVTQLVWLKIIEIDRRKNRLILSELAAMRERRKSSKSELLTSLEEGQVLTGIVTSLADFGAFVDIGGADGLVHLSELAWNRVNHPSEVLHLGDKVTVKVISVDRERKRIGLSMKQLMPEPWSDIEERFVVGEVISATITRLADFGAFARLDGDIEGLIHVSELSDESKPAGEIVQPGDEVTVRVIRVDPDRKRIGLSLKRADLAYDDLVIAGGDDDAAAASGAGNTEAVAEPVAEAAAEPAVEAVAEPVVEAAAEPVVEAVAEPVAEAAAEPAVEAVAEPVAEA
ncbi:MAG: S1 RNA-binding domain-containing protein, partial [Ardenticatenales bacterium]